MTSDAAHTCNYQGCDNTTDVESYRVADSDRPQWFCKKHADELIAMRVILSKGAAGFERWDPKSKSGDSVLEWRATNEEVDELVRQAREKKRSEP